MSDSGSSSQRAARVVAADATATALSPALADSHVHIGSLDRLDDLIAYVSLLGLDGLGLLSLPVAGSGPIGDAVIDFNPEVLAAAHVLPRRAARFGPAAASGAGHDAMVVFGSLDNRALVRGAGAMGWPERAEVWDPAAQVASLADAGFTGLKLWEGKPDLHAALGITLDDARLVAACRVAGDRAMPVLLHVADPRAFWEQSGGPWSYVGSPVAPFAVLLGEAERLVAACPATTFILAHLAFLADAPGELDALLERHPNVIVDLAPGNYLYPALAAATDRSRPKDPAAYAAARALFARHATRILCGSDSFFLPDDLGALSGTPLANNLERLLRLVRFLTTDEVIVSPYALPGSPPLVRGLALDPDVSGQILAGNWRRLCARLADEAERASELGGDRRGRRADTASDREAHPLRDRAAALSWLDGWGRDEDGTRTEEREVRAQRAEVAITEDRW